MYRDQVLENYYMVKEAGKIADLKKAIRNPFKGRMKKVPIDPAQKKALGNDIAEKLKNPEAHGVEVKSLSDLFG
jgi:hypothetical protein